MNRNRPLAIETDIKSTSQDRIMKGKSITIANVTTGQTYNFPSIVAGASYLGVPRTTLHLYIKLEKPLNGFLIYKNNKSN